MAGAGRRVVFFPLPYQGHVNPVMHLARALHTRGLDITVFHTEIWVPEPADYPADYRFVSMPMEAPFRDRLAALVAAKGEEAGGGVQCVIIDTVWYSAMAVARELGVPVLSIMTSSAASFRVYMAYPTLIDKGYLPVTEENKDDPVQELPPYLAKDLERYEMSKLAELAEMFRLMAAGAWQSSGLIVTTFAAIEAANLDQICEDMSIPVFAVAPLNKLAPPAKVTLYGEVQADRQCLGWLDAREPGSVVYMSFGSLAVVEPHEFVELAWGLALSKRPFLWVVRPKLIHGFESCELPDGVLEEVGDRGMIINWAPQEEVLAHPAVGAFFTMEAISEGVPMICHPVRGDQFGNARYVCDVLKVGVELEGNLLERGKIMAAVEKIMDSEEGREIRERMNGLKIAAEKGIKEGERRLLIYLSWLNS
ncbi:unnamed protein product [Urochloa humidicola]